MFLQSTGSFSDKASCYEKIDGAWKELTYSEVKILVERFAAGLSSLGIQAGDKVAIQSTNCPRWAISDYAIACLGAVSVTVYPTLIPSQIKYILDDSDTVYVITENKEQTDKILSIINESDGLKGIIAMDDQSGPSSNIFSFSEILEQGDGYISENGFNVDESAKTARPEDLLTIIYTSGTTGDPKGVMLTHKNLVSNIKATSLAVEVKESDVYLSFLPLSHSFERMSGHYTGFSKGGTTYYAEGVDTVADNMMEVKPTVVIAVPRLYEKIHAKVLDKVSGDPPLRQKIFWWGIDVGQKAAQYLTRGQNPSGLLGIKFKIADKLVFSKLKEKVGGRLRCFISGGAPLSPEVGKFFASANIPILEGYGLTETSPVITCNREELFKFGTVGKPLEGVEVKIAEDGEILCRGDNVMKGYYNNPEATQEVLGDDGWFKTGDIGNFDDEDGYLQITDRKKSLLVTSGGKNIAPTPLELSLCLSKYIEQCLVIGDRRKFISALIVPSFEFLNAWAEKNNVPNDDRKVLCSHSSVLELFDQEVQNAMESFSRYERVKKFALLKSEWTIESGEITPKLSVKRKVVEKNYAEVIDHLYSS
ncbi:MAG: long-chain fatty acid--CoA ligase [Candidatus Marinimicrobia bacterium]|jgi:long-chain acyl-CoA synthetase|nr:long-chain fatty acid--CoA ligase [Candidatus Neomarinimicrobiota bacterium]|tara:strand:- start:5300 stop:7072 length:1773 start_codon:yes stop_codon:yes gene_type:complete